MADYSVERDVAILDIDNPPVNALSVNVREAIANGLAKARSDPSVKAVVICGKGSTFPAGADMKEFAGMREARSRGTAAGLEPVTEIIEGSIKPVVAAIHGYSLGGGFELALSCHYRVADTQARFGLPEVLIGLLPGLGGTQRLPRLVGLKTALGIITTGRHVKVKEAVKLGIVDKVVSGNIRSEGITFARSISSKSLQGRHTSKMSIPDAVKATQIVEESLAGIRKKSPGLIAPVNCVKAVAASVTSPTFEDGLKQEKKLFNELFVSGQAKALQHAFFSQRAAAKWDISGGPSYKTVRPKAFHSGAVIGAGTMGSGITMAMLNAGLPVTLVEQNQEFLERGVSLVKGLYDQSVRLGRMTGDEAKSCLSRLTTTTNYQDLSNTDLVIEAVYEDMSLKKKIFKELDRVCPPAALLGSNTSGLDIDEIASATKRPSQVVGIHFMVPAYYMKLLEIIRGSRTSPETVATAVSFGTKIGKSPVVVGNCHGFVGNRMMGKLKLEALFLIEEGALPADVDRALEDTFGMVMGTFKVGDLSGNDIGWRSRKEQLKSLRLPYDTDTRVMNGERYCPLTDILCEHGRFGRKTGRGWYRYDKPGSKQAFEDPEVTKIILTYCKKHGIQRRTIGPQEIVERCTYALLNEGFKILEEGIASKPGDIDTIWLLGYGWPRQTGGPMFWASQIGLQNLYTRVCHYHRLFPTSQHWNPSDLLKRLSTGTTELPINDWTKVASRL